MIKKRLALFAGTVSLCGLILTTPVRAEEGHPLLKGTLQDTSAGKALDDARVDLSGHLEGGVMGNFDDPDDRLNFGRLFDDRANDAIPNQLLLTIERALAPEEDEFDWGFKLQMMGGSDARYTHAIGWLDNLNDDYIQFDIVEAYANIHLPILTEGGVDVKGGLFVTLQGAEVIPATGNPLYSHSYLFNFAIPLKHSGLMVTTHLTEQIDLYTGVVTGINTGTDDNNDALSFHGGISWKTKDEKIIVFGAAHYGPENDTAYGNPALGGIDPNNDGRIIGDIVVTVKPTESLTLITDLNYGRDDGFDAEWYGVAQYALYQVNSWLTGVVRAEGFRDDDGFAVAKFNDNDDFIDALSGKPAGGAVFGADTTYVELTTGLNVSPCQYVLLRPEVRFDWSTGGNKPFNDGTDNQQWTLGMDVILKF